MLGIPVQDIEIQYEDLDLDPLAIESDAWFVLPNVVLPERLEVMFAEVLGGMGDPNANNAWQPRVPLADGVRRIGPPCSVPPRGVAGWGASAWLRTVSPSC